MYTRLLQRQLNRNLQENKVFPADWQKLLDSINRSYEHYERDHLLAKQSLEISSSEMRALVMELEEGEEKIRAILTSAPDGIFVINEKNQVEICNPLAKQYLGCDNDLIGTNIDSFPVYYNENLEKNRVKSDLSKLNESKLYEFYIQKKDGSFLPIELSMSKIKGQKNLKMFLIRDISTRKLAEKIIALRHEITHLLFKSNSFEVVVPQILTIFCQELGWDTAFLWLKDENLIRPAYYHSKEFTHANEFISKTLELKLPLSDEIKKTFDKSTNSSFFSNLVECTRFLRREEAEHSGFKSYICFPIFFEQKSFGIIELFSRNVIKEDSQLINIITDIGSEIGLFLEHEEAKEREAKLQKQLVSSARQAGMTQVATSILHNVGNVLNSVNVSVSGLKEIVESPEMVNLSKLGSLLESHSHDLSNYINSEDGKNLPNYLISVIQWLKNKINTLKNEVSGISENLEHIKNTIKMQQSMSMVVGLKEKVVLNRLLDDLIGMHEKEFAKNKIIQIKEFGDLPEVILDTSRVLQILENIIRNAIDSLKSQPEDQRLLIFKTGLQDKETLILQISDNGAGIDKKNLTKIFSYGFTTKAEGHGFGIHSSAILASELGGKLIAESEGLGKGATFKLFLPIKPPLVKGSMQSG